MKHTLKRILAILISIMIAMPGTVFADDVLITDVVIGEGGVVPGDDIVIEGDLTGPDDLPVNGEIEAGNGLDLNSLLVSNEPQSPEAAAFEQSAALDGVAFTVKAGAGVFPAGAELRVDGVDAEVAQAAIQSIEATLGGEATHHLYQIQVLDAAGNPLSPNAGVELPQVRVEGLALDDGARVFVYDQTLAGSYEIAVDSAFSFQESGIYDIVEARPPRGRRKHDGTARDKA